MMKAMKIPQPPIQYCEDLKSSSEVLLQVFDRLLCSCAPNALGSPTFWNPSPHPETPQPRYSPSKKDYKSQIRPKPKTGLLGNTIEPRGNRNRRRHESSLSSTLFTSFSLPSWLTTSADGICPNRTSISSNVFPFVSG